MIHLRRASGLALKNRAQRRSMTGAMSENIYNLVPVEIQQPPQPKMYRSKHDPRTPVTGSTFGISGTTQALGAGCIKKRETATFGKPPGSQMPQPGNFLKGGEKTSKVCPRVDVESFQYQGERKQAVPKRNDKPIMGLKTTKNFITANAVEAILQVPKVNVTDGPDYLKKADFGQTPAYLQQVKEEIRRENEMIDAYVKEQMGLSHKDNDDLTEQLDNQERAQLIDALKTKWDAVNAKYQKLTHNVNLDTVGKIKRKEAMETELKILETDIGKLEKPHPIFIKRD